MTLLLINRRHLDVVSSFLEEHFADYISDDFTSEMEDELDDIANGDRAYKKTLSDFYEPFHKAVEAKEDIDKLRNEINHLVNKGRDKSMNVFINVKEINKMWLDSKLVGEEIAKQLEQI